MTGANSSWSARRVCQSSSVALIFEGFVDWEIFFSKVSLNRWTWGYGSTEVAGFSSRASRSSRSSGGIWAFMTSLKVPLCRLISSVITSVNVRALGISVLRRARISSM